MSYTINYDRVKNRVVVISDGMTTDDANSYVAEFPTILGKARPGFTGLTVITGGKVFTPEVLAILGPTGQQAVEAGISQNHKWAYVAPTSLYKSQMRRMFGEVALLYDT